VDRVTDRINAACSRVGRDAASVQLVAVTKYADLEWVQALRTLGITDLGESRPQQLLERAELLDAEIRWHLIGHLQRNKARKVLPMVAFTHSVDSLKLLTAIDRLVEELGISAQVLLEVNVSTEKSKDGFDVQELLSGWDTVLNCQHVEVSGLMTMAPRSENIEDARPVFRELQNLRNQLRDRSNGKLPLQELSMGMSGDFEIAIEEGATIVRLGSVLYNGLTRREQT